MFGNIQFETPSAFLLFLLIPILVIVHYLHSERVLIKASAFSIWQEIFEEVKPKSFWTQILRNLLLYFHVFFIVFVVIAIANPYFHNLANSGKKAVLLIDNSASMNTVENGVSRLEQAKSAALSLLEGKSVHEFMVVPTIRLGNDKTSPLVFLSDKSKITEKISQIRPTSLSENISPLLDKIHAAGKESHSIYYFGDGNLASTVETLKKAREMTVVSVGRSVENLGIVNFSSRFIRQINSEREIRLAVKNFGQALQKTEVEIYLNGKSLMKKALSIGGGESKKFTLKVSPELGGVFKASLLKKDSYMDDNTAYSVVLGFLPTAVKLVSNSYPAKLLQALRIQKGLSVDSFSEKQFRAKYPTGSIDKNSIGIFYKVPHGGTPFLRNIYISPDMGETHSLSAVPAWQEQHPILKNMDFSFDLNKMLLLKTSSVHLTEKEYSLLGSKLESLIFSREDAGVKNLFFTFDIEDMGFSMQPSFPLFIRHLISWLKESDNLEKYNIEAGEAFYTQLNENSEEGFVVTPDGTKLSIRPIKQNIIFTQTLSAGLYTVKVGEWKKRFSVRNDSRESYIAPKIRDLNGNVLSVELLRESMRSSFIKTWKIFAIIALLLIIGEWWYQKRGIYKLY